MNEKIILDILDFEWEMFAGVNNFGGCAPCQEDFMTFKIMRTSQAEAERGGPLDQPGQLLRPPEQQVVDELPASGGLRSDKIPSGQLVALGEHADHVVGGAQHQLPGSHHGGRVLPRSGHLG